MSNNLPFSTISKYSYSNFCNLMEAYLSNLERISQNKTPSISQNDFIVLNDLLDESLKYSKELIHNGYPIEAHDLLNFGLMNLDVFIRIIDQLPIKKDNNITIAKKLENHLIIKLSFLEEIFNVLFKYIQDFDNAEKILLDILDIQQFLNFPIINIASSKFYQAILKFYRKDLETAEKIAEEAIDLLKKKNEREYHLDQKDDKKQNEEKNQNEENRKVMKIANILEFIAQIYALKKDFNKMLLLYQKAYYLTLGRFGENNVNTVYFKKRIEIAKDEQQLKTHQNFSKGVSKQQKFNTDINDMSSSDDMDKNLNDKNYYSLVPQQETLRYKGRAKTFAFVIEVTNLYEPFIVSIYKLSSGNIQIYEGRLFVCHLYFDKGKLMWFLNEKEGNNSVFYTDENLNKILNEISLSNNKASCHSSRLQSALIMSTE